MDALTIASNAADARVPDQVAAHHAELLAALAARVSLLTAATAAADDVAADNARLDLVDWSRTVLLAHAAAEEHTFYAAARASSGGRLFVDGMLAAHRSFVDIIDDVQAATSALDAACLATALRVGFEVHVWQENELLLPLLASDPEVNLARLHDELGQLFGLATGGHEAAGSCGCGGHEAAGSCGCGGHEHAGSCGCGGHEAADATACTCGEHDDPAATPVLDAREVPHAIRHATVFGALDAVGPGGGLILLAPHDPLPLLAQIAQRFPGQFEVGYLQRGPEVWRLGFTRIR